MAPVSSGYYERKSPLVIVVLVEVFDYTSADLLDPDPLACIIVIPYEQGRREGILLRMRQGLSIPCLGGLSSSEKSRVVLRLLSFR